MSLSLILLILAGVLVVLDMILWNVVVTYRRHVLTPLALLFVIIALLLGSGAILT